MQRKIPYNYYPMGSMYYRATKYLQNFQAYLSKVAQTFSENDKVMFRFMLVADNGMELDGVGVNGVSKIREGSTTAIM